MVSGECTPNKYIYDWRLIMITKICRFLLLLTLILSLDPSTVMSKNDETIRVEKSIQVFKQFMSDSKDSIPTSLLNDAYGIAVLPEVIKVGLGFGGRHGEGILVVKTKYGWSNPTFIGITGGSVGFQIGVSSTDIILVFKSKKSIDNIRNGKFTIGADASIAAGPLGKHVEASTDIQFKAEIYSYSQSRGAFIGVSLEGSSLHINHRANEVFYNRLKIPVTDIFASRKVKVPSIAKQFRKVLYAYTH